jgi:exodeoxyribonuclease VII small subunit
MSSMARASETPGVTSSESIAGSEAAAGAPPFEQTLAQLEALVVRLESGELPLDEALRAFEHGVRLTRECQAALSSAQQRVQVLLQRGETAVLEEFDTSGIERVSVTTTATTTATASFGGASGPTED